MQELVMNVISVIFGIASLYGALSSATKLRPLFSRGKGPAYPISLIGRVTLGTALLVEGIRGLTQ
jgi:hypothetical protein